MASGGSCVGMTEYGRYRGVGRVCLASVLLREHQI